MAGKLRKRDTLASKAEGCCARCCGACRNWSKPAQALCWSIILLTFVTFLVWIIGASMAGAARTTDAPSINCETSDDGSGTDSTMGGTTVIPTVPLIGQNIYTWYLANTGIFVMLMVLASCLCCGAYICLCCGDFPRGVTILSVICFILVILAGALFIGWVALGTYLLTTYGATVIISQALCRNTAIYIVLLYIYAIVFILVCIAAGVWKICNLGSKPNIKMPTKV